MARSVGEIDPRERSEIRLNYAKNWGSVYYAARSEYLHSFAGPHMFITSDWPETEDAWNSSLPSRDCTIGWDWSIYNLTGHILEVSPRVVVAAGTSANELLVENAFLSRSCRDANIPILWIPGDISSKIYNNAINHEETFDAHRSGEVFHTFAKSVLGYVPDRVMFIDDIVRSSGKIDYASQAISAAGIDVTIGTLFAPFTSDLIQFAGSIDKNMYAYAVNLALSYHFLGNSPWQKRVIREYGNRHAIERLGLLVQETANILRGKEDTI